MNNTQKEADKKKIIDIWGVKIDWFYQRSVKAWKITKVRFESNEGWIFFKPYKEKEIVKDVSGKKICFVSQEMIEAWELPPIISEISDLAFKQGMCKIKAQFRVWKRKGVKDYQYFKEEDVNGIEILPIETKVV